MKIQNKEYDFGLIGFGKLGIHLAKGLEDEDRIKWILARSEGSIKRVKEAGINRHKVREKIQLIEKLPKMIIIAVSDTSVHNVAVSLAEKFREKLKDVAVIHTSGVLGKNVLAPCEHYGAKVAAVHPFQSFFYGSENPLTDIRWGIDCDDEDYILFSSFVQFLYGFPVRLNKKSEKDKALYHAVATAASNYMTSIIQLAHKIADTVEIDANEFLPPIAKTTLGNNLRGLSDSDFIPLTGPIARADLGTIKLHIKAMKDNPDILKPYCYMGLATNEMAKNAGLIEENDFKVIHDTFKAALQ